MIVESPLRLVIVVVVTICTELLLLLLLSIAVVHAHVHLVVCVVARFRVRGAGLVHLWTAELTSVLLLLTVSGAAVGLEWGQQGAPFAKLSALPNVFLDRVKPKVGLAEVVRVCALMDCDEAAFLLQLGELGVAQGLSWQSGSLLDRGLAIEVRSKLLLSG